MSCSTKSEFSPSTSPISSFSDGSRKMAIAIHDQSEHTATTDGNRAPRAPLKRYDFRRPDKFSKDHVRALRVLHESFARLLSSSLTSYLRSNVQVRLTGVEQVPYEDYVQS